MVGPVTTLVFATRLGHVAMAWSARGIARFALPGDRGASERTVRDWANTVALIFSDNPPDDAPAFVRHAMQLTRAYCDGAIVDFSVLPLDLDVDSFRRAIYQAAVRLKHGTVATYGELAEWAGYPGMARETGAALGANPVPLIVPCHRIVAAGGRIGGFSAPGGTSTKRRLLAHEGVRIGPLPPAQASFGF